MQRPLKGDNPKHMAATLHIQTAIKKLRGIGRQKERIRQLTNVLMDFQEKTMEEMNEFSHTVDLTKTVEEVENRVRGLSKIESLIALVILYPLPKVSRLREEAIDHIKKHPLQHLVSRSKVREGGKVVCHSSDPYSEDPHERERAVYEQIIELATLHFSFIVQGVIEPARQQINVEHNFTIRDFLDITADSPFVPPGHEYIFATALHYGMRGDYLVASHLLAPQVENAIRYFLGMSGVKTTSLDATGIQKELSLNALITEGEGQQISQKTFGEDLYFFIRWLLVEPTGANFRNRIAHGMVDDAECYSVSSVLLWWLSLYLCVFPILRDLKQDLSAQDSSDQTD